MSSPFLFQYLQLLVGSKQATICESLLQHAASVKLPHISARPMPEPEMHGHTLSIPTCVLPSSEMQDSAFSAIRRTSGRAEWGLHASPHTRLPTIVLQAGRHGFDGCLIGNQVLKKGAWGLLREACEQAVSPKHGMAFDPVSAARLRVLRAACLSSSQESKSPRVASQCLKEVQSSRLTASLGSNMRL